MTRQDQARATRDQLIGIARELFAEHGYEAASLELVQRQAGLSRGAVYHHFPSKRALFAATLDAVEADVAARLAQRAGTEGDPLERLRAGSLAWLELARDPGIRRIALIDGPSVVGWQEQRAIDQRRTLGLLRTVLEELEVLDRIPEGTAEVLGHVLFATLNELGLYVANAADASSAHTRAAVTLDLVLARLFGAADEQDHRSAATTGGGA